MLAVHLHWAGADAAIGNNMAVHRGERDHGAVRCGAAVDHQTGQLQAFCVPVEGAHELFARIATAALQRLVPNQGADVGRIDQRWI